jgi:putative nucleotidyltransferase with HDIG domain
MTEMQDTVARSLLGESVGDTSRRPSSAYHGEALVITLYRALKGATFYTRENPSFQLLVREAFLLVALLLESAETLSVKIGRDACFCNNALIRYTADAYAGYSGFLHLLRQRGIGQLTFFAGITEAELLEFILLLYALEEGQAENSTAITNQLVALGVTTLSVEPYAERPDENDGDDALKRQARGVYFSSIGVCKELMDSAVRSPLNLRKAKRLMLSAVGMIMKDESTLLGLASIKRYDDYTYNHSVNVAIYAMALGNRLGLPPKYLNYLGIIGLFHDIGKTEVSKEILHKPGALTAEEWEQIRQHPLQGAEMVLRLKGWGQVSALMIEGSFEHHLRYDLTGYPRVQRTQPPALFSRIITIADCYDALARPRVYRQTPYVTERILALLLQESGKQFDPLLVKVFINLIGIYPIGTLVLLNTGEIGIVTRIPADPALIATPQVCLLKRDGARFSKGDVVDLAETDAAGAHPRRIAESLNPNDYALNIEEFYFM